MIYLLIYGDAEWRVAMASIYFILFISISARHHHLTHSYSNSSIQMIWMFNFVAQRTASLLFSSFFLVPHWNKSSIWYLEDNQKLFWLFTEIHSSSLRLKCERQKKQVAKMSHNFWLCFIFQSLIYIFFSLPIHCRRPAFHARAIEICSLKVFRQLFNLLWQYCAMSQPYTVCYTSRCSAGAFRSTRFK